MGSIAFRPQRALRCGSLVSRPRCEPARHLGHQSRSVNSHRWSRSESGGGADAAAARRGEPGASIHRPRTGRVAGRIGDRPRVHRFLHQCSHRRLARSSQGRSRTQGRSSRASDGGARLGCCTQSGGGRGHRRGVDRCRIRMAAARMFHVSRDERRCTATRRALRLDYQSQFRRPAGARRPYASDEPVNGCCRRDCRLHHGCAPIGASAVASEKTIAGVAAALPIANLDTDQIMPKQFLRGIDKSGLDKGVLYDLRFDGEGKPRADFVLNRPEYAGCQILVAAENFGCGSSREHAVWGLLQFGIRAVIAPSFGEIFHSNAMNNGLLLVVAPQARRRSLHARCPGAGEQLDVDRPRSLASSQRCRTPPGSACRRVIARCFWTGRISSARRWRAPPPLLNSSAGIGNNPPGCSPSARWSGLASVDAQPSRWG